MHMIEKINDIISYIKISKKLISSFDEHLSLFKTWNGKPCECFKQSFFVQKFYDNE